MKLFRFFTFSALAIASLVLIIIGMSTLHWLTTNSSSTDVFGAGGLQTHSGLRRWFTDTSNGVNSHSQGWSSNCVQSDGQCQMHTAGSWALGWGIASLALIALALIFVAVISCTTVFDGYGFAGKSTGALLMFLAALCILIGAFTYWSHLPLLAGTLTNLSWSFILYSIGGGLAFFTSFVLCLMPSRQYYEASEAVGAQPVVAMQPVVATQPGIGAPTVVVVN